MSGLLAYGRQTIEDDDVAAVAAALRGEYLTTGPLVERFEAALAAATGAAHAVACGNGTQALHLACLAAGLGPGDLAVVPAVTFLATANAVRYCGAEVAFADVDPDSGLMTAATAARALDRAGGAAKAVLPVHLAGQMADVEAIGALAPWTVIEDACHALGTAWTDRAGRPRRVGDANLATFSFHPVKTVTTAEGGAVTTADAGLAARMRSLRSHGMTRPPGAAPWVYEMAEIGFNYRLPDLLCALGLSQLAKLDRFVARRRALAARYDRLLAGFGNRLRPLARRPACDPAWHLYVVLVDFAACGRDRAAVMAGLRERGIGSQVHYIPVADQPYYRARYGPQDLPGARAFYARCLSLPLFPAMAEGDPDRVVAALAEVLGL